MILISVLCFSALLFVLVFGAFMLYCALANVKCNQQNTWTHVKNNILQKHVLQWYKPAA